MGGIWWLSAVCSLTMPNDAGGCNKDIYCQGLFIEVSNGFIGCWGGMLLSIALSAQLFGVQVGGDQPGVSHSHTEPTAPPAASTPPETTEIESNPTKEGEANDTKA